MLSRLGRTRTKFFTAKARQASISSSNFSLCHLHFSRLCSITADQAKTKIKRLFVSATDEDFRNQRALAEHIGVN